MNLLTLELFPAVSSECLGLSLPAHFAHDVLKDSDAKVTGLLNVWCQWSQHR